MLGPEYGYYQPLQVPFVAPAKRTEVQVTNFLERDFLLEIGKRGRVKRST